MKTKIVYAFIGIVIVILSALFVFVWCGIQYCGIKEYYDMNPNSLWVTIPVVILINSWICFTLIKENKL